MTGRIRSIKPEWIDSELFCSASDASIRLAFVLLSLVDDDGRVRISVRALGLRAWGFCDEVADKTSHARAALDGLSRVGWLDEYEVGGVACWQIRNFAKHQRIDKYKASKLPPPPEPSREVATSRDESRMVEPDQDQDQDQGSGEGSGSAREAPSVSAHVALFRAYVAAIEARTGRHESETPDKLKAARAAHDELERTAANRKTTVADLLAVSVDRWLSDAWGKRTGWKFTEWAKQASALAVADPSAPKRGSPNVAPPTSHAEFNKSVQEHGGAEKGWADVGI